MIIIDQIVLGEIGCGLPVWGHAGLVGLLERLQGYMGAYNGLMERARVAVIEDSGTMRMLVRAYLEDEGHHVVVAEAADMEAAQELLADIHDGTLEVDVILLDGNLSDRDRTGADARANIEMIRELGIGAAVLGFSAESMQSYGVDVAADTRKKLPAVLEAIAALPEAKRN